MEYTSSKAVMLYCSNFYCRMYCIEMCFWYYMDITYINFPSFLVCPLFSVRILFRLMSTCGCYLAGLNKYWTSFLFILSHIDVSEITVLDECKHNLWVINQGCLVVYGHALKEIIYNIWSLVHTQVLIRIYTKCIVHSTNRAFICLLKLSITVLHVAQAAFFHLVALLNA